MRGFSPDTDGIPFPYSVKTVEQKMHNKTELQKELGWPVEPKRAMVCLPAGMSDELGGALMKEVMSGILTQPVELLIVGKGSNDYGKYFTKLAIEESHRVHIVPQKDEALMKMYAASDMALFFTDPTGLPELAHCLEFGVVPVAPATKSLEAYNPIEERGVAFLYEEPSVWHCFAGLVRALETFKFPFDWRTIQKHCMGTVVRK